MEMRLETDVLICGAGAAGLTLAVDLARRGVRLCLIDALDGPFRGSRGKGIQPRTLEIFEDLGVVDRLAAVGAPYPPIRTHAADGTHADAPMAATPATQAEPYSVPLLVPQFRTEAVLRERLAELGYEVAFGTRLIGFAEHDGTVTARVTSAGSERTIACRYLIGADGGRSFVRHELGIGFPGETLGVRAIVADIAVDGLSRDAWHRFNDGDMRRQLSFCPLPQTDLFVLQAPIPLEGEPDLSADGLQRFIDERLPGTGIHVRAVNWASAYAMNARLADRYRAGSTFLIGDAAHVHPPTGGQGLNTSVQDAYNLGWKLAAVLEGAPVALLDTYEEERRPIAAGVLGLSTDLLDKFKRGDLSRGRETRQLDLGYRDSSLSLNGIDAAAVLAGDRLPDHRLLGAGGQARRLFDCLAGPHWTALVRAGEDTPSLRPRKGLRILRLGKIGEASETAGRIDLAEGTILLIRPDGYVGARMASDDPRLARYLDGVLPGSALSDAR